MLQRGGAPVHGVLRHRPHSAGLPVGVARQDGRQADPVLCTSWTFACPRAPPAHTGLWSWCGSTAGPTQTAGWRRGRRRGRQTWRPAGLGRAARVRYSSRDAAPARRQRGSRLPCLPHRPTPALLRNFQCCHISLFHCNSWHTVIVRLWHGFASAAGESTDVTTASAPDV